MTVVVDTSILIDVLRGELAAAAVLRDARQAGPLHASGVTRLEVLAGMRAQEEHLKAALNEVAVGTVEQLRVELHAVTRRLGGCNRAALNRRQPSG